jgi:hypothetical protein
VGIKLAARAHALKVINTLAKICFDEGNPPAARVSAGMAVLAYGLGKPEGRVSIDVDLARKKISELSIDEVREMQSKIALASIEAAAVEAEENEPSMFDLNELAMEQPVPVAEDFGGEG